MCISRQTTFRIAISSLAFQLVFSWIQWLLLKIASILSYLKYIAVIFNRIMLVTACLHLFWKLALFFHTKLPLASESVVDSPKFREIKMESPVSTSSEGDRPRRLRYIPLSTVE